MLESTLPFVEGNILERARVGHQLNNGVIRIGSGLRPEQAVRQSTELLGTRSVLTSETGRRDNRTMDRDPFTKPFTVENLPAWKCPRCAAGHLTLQKDNLKFDQTAESRAEQEMNSSDFDWIRYRFGCIFHCSRCNDTVSCAGTGLVDRADYYDENGEHQTDYADEFYPSYFHPALQLMDMPTDCPREVIGHLQTSFSMFFANPAAALNSARIAIEALMDHFQVITEWPESGRRMDLHPRIERMPAQHAKVREHLLAAKWLGNAGSHHGEMPERKDVIDVYDVLEFALHAIFDRTEERVRLTVERINRDRGLPRK